MDAAGDFVVAWDNYTTAVHNFGATAQRYDAAGVAAREASSTSSTASTGIQSHPAVAMDSAGDFVLGLGIQRPAAAVWVWPQNDTTPRARPREANSSDALPWQRPLAIPPWRWTPPATLSIAASGYDGSDYGIYADRYNTSGAEQGSTFLVNTYTAGDQRLPSVAMDSSGDFVVAWQSDGEDGTIIGIYAQAYSSSGTASRRRVSRQHLYHRALRLRRRWPWMPPAISSWPGTARARTVAVRASTPSATVRTPDHQRHEYEQQRGDLRSPAPRFHGHAQRRHADGLLDGQCGEADL